MDVSVSVVIPTYNRADRVERAIVSAVEQKPGPLEVVVVDDGSTDGTDARVLEAVDRRVRVVRHERNRGVAAARNTGIDAAQGEWIAFLDSDNQWLPGKLERQWSQVGAVRDKKVFACANVIYEGGPKNGRVRNSRPPRNDEDISRFLLLEGLGFSTSTWLMPAELVREFRFDERLVLHEDWDLLLRLVRQGVRYLYCDEPLANIWDGRDPNRLTSMPSFDPTLLWLSIARDRVAPDAAAAYYFKAVFRRHFAAAPAAAFLKGLELTFASPRAFMHVWRKLVANGRERLSAGLPTRRG